MIPSTVTTAILLLRAPLSLSSTSSRRGPASRAEREEKPLFNPPAVKLNACEMACAKLPSRLNNSSTTKIMAKIIQPRLLRGLDGCGAAMTGGGDMGGGASPAEKFVSIMGETTAKPADGQGGLPCKFFRQD